LQNIGIDFKKVLPKEEQINLYIENPSKSLIDLNELIENNKKDYETLSLLIKFFGACFESTQTKIGED